MSEELAIKIEHVTKQYRLGAIGGGTLKGDLQTWWARMRGKEDPNSIVGSKTDIRIGEKFLALDDINLEVKKGEAVGIIGHNGAGKSTLLKLLSRVTAPTEGKISIDGRIASMLEVGTGFHPELTGRENIYMNGAILGMTRAEIDKKFDQIVEFSEVAKFIDTPVKRYSSGMYVKLAFSVAAHLDSEIMIMDEVLAVGDMAFQKKCLERMRTAAKDEGRTVLYVSHNMNTIRQLCDRCIVLDHGKIIFDGNVEEAIELYLGIKKDENLPIEYDLSSVKRFYGFGESIFVKKVRFSGKKEPIYSSEESVRIEVALNSKIDVSDIRMIVGIKDSNYSKVGMAISDPFEIKQGVTDRISFDLDIGMLSSGVYSIDLSPVCIYPNKEFFTFDDPGVPILFEVDASKSSILNWHKEYWGTIMFPVMTYSRGNLDRSSACLAPDWSAVLRDE